MDYTTGWGFVANPELMHIHGRDVFLLGVKDSNDNYLSPGDIVVFGITIVLGNPRVKASFIVRTSLLRSLRLALQELAAPPIGVDSRID